MNSHHLKNLLDSAKEIQKLLDSGEVSAEALDLAMKLDISNAISDLDIDLERLADSLSELSLSVSSGSDGITSLDNTFWRFYQHVRNALTLYWKDHGREQPSIDMTGN